MCVKTLNKEVSANNDLICKYMMFSKYLIISQQKQDSKFNVNTYARKMVFYDSARTKSLIL